MFIDVAPASRQDRGATHRVSEIVDQIVQAKFRTEEGAGINNLVLMGMGEPLDNYDNVLKAIAIITSGLRSSSTRRITLSTCGIAPGIERLKALAVNLAVSSTRPTTGGAAS